MNEREYRKLRRAIRLEYRKNLSALDVVWRIANKTNPPEITAPELKKRPPVPPAEAGPSTMARIADIVVKLPSQFNSRDVIEAAEKLGVILERSTVSHSLMRMSRDGRIRLESRGSGRLPAVFTKIEPSVVVDTLGFSTPEQQEAIRNMAKAKKYELEPFVALLRERYGVEKLAHLTRSQAEELREDVQADRIQFSATTESDAAG